ncbi:hypothetical protein MUP79_08465 [Candidatus Bathyarchaeota archaeon]|nr:hypothetical protein [Candidatus Bathyarchaeota archaeon]
MVYFLWLASVANDATVKIGYYGIAASFVISLIPALQGIFGEKENPSELLYRVQQLTKPLQDIHGNLAYGAGQIPEAVSVFAREIEHKALLKMLKQDSPALVASMTKLKTLTQETETRESTRDEDLLRALSRDGSSQVLKIRLANNEEARRLVEKVQKQIEDLLAKYGGFH